MLQNLRVKDVNNLHLVCRNLHQIANLHVNPKLSFDWNYPGDMESLVQSSRIFEALEFYWCYFSGYIVNQEKFEPIEEYLSSTGAHIKKLTFSHVKVDQKIYWRLLNLLPNLETLELGGSTFMSVNQEQSIKWDLKSQKIERIKTARCTNSANWLEPLEKSVIKELEFTGLFNVDSEAVRKFLKVQEKNLKKLTIRVDSNWLNDLKDLRLEYLEYCGIRRNYSGPVSLEFLKRQENLKFLILKMGDFSDENLNVIWKLKNLETLELEASSEMSDRSSLNGIHKLEKLKRLKVCKQMSCNILDHLQFGHFNELEELDASLSLASLESIGEMKRITPRLRKIEVYCKSSDQIDALLETLQNLESVKIKNGQWKVPSEKFYPKVKYLHVSRLDYISADQISKIFPNLELLTIYECSLNHEPESFLVTLLSQLKQLKTLDMEIWSDLELDPESVLQCFQQYGKHLEDVQVAFSFQSLEIVQIYTFKKSAEGDSYSVTRKHRKGSTTVVALPANHQCVLCSICDQN